MTGSESGTVTIADEQETSEIGSDGDVLADELGSIGVSTVDDDKLEVQVSNVELTSDDKVRLWYEFPTGGYIPEEFEKPMPWNPDESKLARIIEDAGLSPGSTSMLESSDVSVVIEKREKIIDDASTEVGIVPPNYRAKEKPGRSWISYMPDAAQVEISGDTVACELSTWESTDPVEFVDDEYEETAVVRTYEFRDGAFIAGMLSVLTGIGFFSWYVTNNIGEVINMLVSNAGNDMFVWVFILVVALVARIVF